MQSSASRITIADLFYDLRDYSLQPLPAPHGRRYLALSTGHKDGTQARQDCLRIGGKQAFPKRRASGLHPGLQESAKAYSAGSLHLLSDQDGRSILL